MSTAGAKKKDADKEKESDTSKARKDKTTQPAESSGRHHKRTEVKFHQPVTDEDTSATEAVIDGIKNLSLEGKEKEKEKKEKKDTEKTTSADEIDISTQFGALTLVEKTKAPSTSTTSSAPSGDEQHHHKPTEVKFHTPLAVPPTEAKPPKPTDPKPPKEDKEKLKVRKEDIEANLNATLDAVHKEDEDAVRIHHQGAQVGRIHNNVEKTGVALDQGRQDLHETASCGAAVLGSLRRFFCCCCAHPAPAPHHDQDFEAAHPAPVAFNPSNPSGKTGSKPKTRKELLDEQLAATEHWKATLEGETKELADQNGELKEVIVETDENKKKTAEAEKEGRKILGKK